MKIDVKKVPQPAFDHENKRVFLSDETIEKRKQAILALMKKYQFSSLIIYADKEHGSNFEYLTGFIPRFEEALLVLNSDGSSTLVLGNENVNKVKYARIASKGVKCPFFSLPNQPMDFTATMKDYLEEANIDASERVGLVGWKLLSAQLEDFVQLFDIPEWIVSGIKEVVGEEKVWNATALFIDASEGARVVNNANEIAFYEYGASLASDGVLAAMNQLEVGVSETTVGDQLNKEGQYNSVVTIAAFGERFAHANLYPTEKTLSHGDKVALTVAYKGGLSSRSGYAVQTKEELEQVDPGYFTEMVVPYFSAYHFWLEQIKIGANAGEFFAAFNTFFPQKTHGWELCPGHLVADEEWLSSPFYSGSNATVKSGMIFQLDFIPVHPKHHGVSAESTLVLADVSLRAEIQTQYPQLWDRMVERRRYLKEVLGIDLKEEVLPMCSTLGYLRPYLLNQEAALVVSS
ncbi:MAG: M24 family metallopeptidase [Enterococcus aquimarinus]|uniref:M24 family metallopeptidase n=1 Tax=Enterococcus aquimarinus TaxID=328396 RepID=A0A9E3ZWH6_9ENTE|nr:M24 family metallopeptidase [Enterococcus aquimarinus]